MIGNAPHLMIGNAQSRPRITALLTTILILATPALSATKTHSVTFGKWSTVRFASDADGPADEAPAAISLAVKVRPLLVDAHIKEFTFGAAHDVTERLFVVRRAFRINDTLPQEPSAPLRWIWERGGWLLVDRTTGHVAAVNLPDFDSSYSEVTWYRGYAAYCGLSVDGKKTYAVVAQINRRKPILKMPLPAAKPATANTTPSRLECMLPEWQRSPVRVTFEPNSASKMTFVIRGEFAESLTEDEEDEEASR
jgi:hypothetical protein